MTLLPCPFCGSEACSGSDSIGYSIQCGDCGARSVPMMYFEGAVERWNRRYEPEDPAADPRLVREFLREGDDHMMRLCAISTACYANTHESMREHSIDKTHPYWTLAYDDVLTAIKREIRQRERAEKAEQERDALAKDAERYRWLRDDKYWADICHPVHGNDCEHVAGAELDSVIDAALISGRDAT